MKLNPLPGIDMLLMVENILEEEDLTLFIKDYDKNKESSYIQYWNVNKL